MSRTWPGIGYAGYPGEQSLQFRRQRAGARQVAQSYATTPSKDTRELACGGLLVGECTEGALADHRVKAAVGNSQPLGIALFESHPVSYSGLLGSQRRLLHVAGAEINAYNFAVKTGGDEDGALAAAGGYIEDALSWLKAQQFAQARG
jgi:hypothetical protein